MTDQRFLGIDLGTTNSVAVLGGGERPAPVRTADGGHLLPSVVRFDARGNVTVGARARRFLDSDPENTRSEFKRLMGTGRKLSFRSAKLEKSPEELSALVLGALRAQAEQLLGHAPRAVVVTVPALFELPQTRATSEAARLAGFERVEHLQEPVASALTAGWKRGDDAAPWLVYDLGGGTFDVSLLETREGVLRVIDHDGDNFLGGRDMDARLLEHVLEELSKAHGRPFRRADPALAPMLRRLRTACEDAKMELGASRDTSVSLAEPIVVDGEEVLVDVPLSAAEFGPLVLPIVDRSIEVCLRLLTRQGLATTGVGRIVLVGGPTIMPLLRRRLEERLGIALATDVDPMTAVAEGAAFFAAEHDLATTGVSPKTSGALAPKPAGAATGERVWLQYPSVSGDLYPYVVGRVTPGKVASVKLSRSDGAFTSAEEKVDEDGSFVVQIELTPRAASTFHVRATDPKGAPITLDPSEITLRHGLSLADPPLSRTIGIALADGGVQVFFERGAPLPSRKTFRLRTSLTVHPGQKESAISVPIVQGEVTLAHLCRLVGTIELRPESLESALPAGSPVDVVLELDRGGRLTATAQLPDRHLTFPGTLVLVSPDAPLDALEAQLGRLRGKTESLYTDPLVDDASRKKLVAIDALLDDATNETEAARGGDPDAIEKLRRLLIEVDGSLADVEAQRAWPELESDAMRSISIAIHWVSRTGTEMDRRTLDEAIRSLERARAMRNINEMSKRLDNVRRIGNAAYMRDPDSVRRELSHLATSLGEMRDPRAARELVTKGEAALARGDVDEARRSAYALMDLLPPEEQVRVKAHGSGVER
jgi:molecular chaperone DnaK